MFFFLLFIAFLPLYNIEQASVQRRMIRLQRPFWFSIPCDCEVDSCRLQRSLNLHWFLLNRNEKDLWIGCPPIGQGSLSLWEGNCNRLLARRTLVCFVWKIPTCQCEGREGGKGIKNIGQFHIFYLTQPFLEHNDEKSHYYCFHLCLYLRVIFLNRIWLK